jgi:hypothetical protein
MPLHAWRLQREEPLVVFDELEHTHDLRAKLLGRRKYAAGDDDD